MDLVPIRVGRPRGVRGEPESAGSPSSRQEAPPSERCPPRAPPRRGKSSRGRRGLGRAGAEGERAGERREAEGSEAEGGEREARGDGEVQEAAALEGGAGGGLRRP